MNEFLFFSDDWGTCTVFIAAEESLLSGTATAALDDDDDDDDDDDPNPICVTALEEEDVAPCN